LYTSVLGEYVQRFEEETYLGDAMSMIESKSDGREDSLKRRYPSPCRGSTTQQYNRFHVPPSLT
jgi:hypothetical protein